MSRSPKRESGNAVAMVLLVLVLVVGVLGLNYVRNYQVDQQQEKNNRPYARYKVGDLEVLAQGYRVEIETREKRYGRGRVQTRDRHHFSDQIQEFERVQKAARGARDKAVEIAQLRKDLQAVEEELQRRSAAGTDLIVHLERMFRI